MAQLGLGLGFTHPMIDNPIRIFACVCEHIRDTSQVTNERSRQRTLAVYGKNNCPIKTTFSQTCNKCGVLMIVGLSMLHPSCSMGHHVVYIREVRSQLRSARRGQQRDM